MGLVELLIGPDFKRGEAAVGRFVEDDLAESSAEAKPSGGGMNIDTNNFGIGASNTEVGLGLYESSGLSRYDGMGMEPTAAHDLSFVLCDPESVGIRMR